MKQQKLLEAESQVRIAFKHKHRSKFRVVITDRYLLSLILPQSSFCIEVVFKKYHVITSQSSAMLNPVSYCLLEKKKKNQPVA